MKPTNILFLFFLLFFLHTLAQDSTVQKTKTSFSLSLNYNSSLHYYGRTDSLKSSGMFPLAEVWFSENWYVKAAPVFVSSAGVSPEYAGTVAAAGYQHESDEWITGFSLMKPFYTETADVVQSALKAQVSASFTKLQKAINLTVGGDLKWSDRMDFGATAGLDHLIKKRNRDSSAWVIDPSAFVYAGTQQFSRSYLKKTPGFLLLPGNTEEETKEVRQFNVLAYEFSVPVVYSKKSWQLMATPCYVVPCNLIHGEKGEPMFYTTLMLKYSF